MNWLLGPEVPIRRPTRTPLAALDFSPRSRPDLFLRVLFAAVPNQGPDRAPNGILPARRLSAGGCGGVDLHGPRFWFAPTLLWFGSSDRALMLLAGSGLIASILIVLNHLAARVARDLLRLLSFVRRRGAGFLRLSIGRHAARSRIHLAVFRAPGLWPGLAARITVRRAPACSCCAGNGSASISNRAWRRWRAATIPGATSRRWTTTTRTARCPRGSAGTCSNFRIGSTPRP